MAPHWLTEAAPLAVAVCWFSAAYWGARLLLQFVHFDRDDAPSGLQYTLAEAVFVLHFAFFTGVYLYAGFRGLGQLP